MSDAKQQWIEAFNHQHNLQQALGNAHSHNLQGLGSAHSHNVLSAPYVNALAPAARSFEVFEREFASIRKALADYGIDRGTLEELLKEVRDLRAQLADVLAVSRPVHTDNRVTEHFPLNAIRHKPGW